ncbi:MAG: sporulation protein YqfD [Clostridia bacterium]|nr:sporulation protein YqfD [Clostridia bacterium]
MFRDKLLVTGILPERALLRLKREGVGVYNAKKIRKNALLFSVKKKDTEKVFAIYPKVCYNEEGENGYRVSRVGAERTGKLLDFFKKRWGIAVGIGVFFALTGFLGSFVLRVEITGTNIYEREILCALEKNGVKTFSRYDDKNIDMICSEILSLDGVGFCSVKKSGNCVKVEVRMNPFAEPKTQKGQLVASRSGTILSLAVLRGTPLKKVGDTVRAGEAVVGDYILVTKEGEERVGVVPIAKVKLACVYEEEINAQTEQEAFAKAYLALGLSDKGEITGKSFVQNGDSFHVKLCYTEIQTINF